MNLSILLDPYDVLEMDSSSLRVKLKRASDIKGVMLTGILVPLMVVAFFLIKSEAQYLILMLPPMLIYVRMLQIKDPITIFVHQGELVLTYKKYFGGHKDVVLDASMVKNFVPHPFRTSDEDFWIASVQVHLSNDKTRRIFSAPRGIGKKEVATLHSELVAGVFTDIFNGHANWQNALTSRSS